MSAEKMREEFELEFRNSSRVAGDQAYAGAMLERGSDGKYRSFWIAGAWWGWQASRAAIEVELRDAYMKGWEASGKGWNGEYPALLHETERWQRERDRALGLEEKPC